MPTAILKIDGDTSGLARAFGALRAEAKATETAIRSSMTAAFGASTAAAQRGARAQQQASSRAASAAEADARRTVVAVLRAEDQKRRAAQVTAANRARAEQEATRIAQTEARKRGLTAEQEARLRQTTLERVTRVVENEERKQTAAAQREQRKRDRAGRDVGIGIRRGLNVGGDAALNVARAAHGQIQDARRQRAEAERTLGQAVRNAGGNEGDVSSARSQVRSFVEQTGMSFADVARALSVGQASGSSLQAGRGETQADATRRALSLVREANAEGADPGQYLAARGRLAEAGLQGSALTTAMRFALGAAQAGQVEVDQIIGQGLPGASRLMAQRVASLGPNASAESQQRARLAAWRESVSTQEVLAASGGAAGHTANTLASLSNFLATPRRQEMALTNIKAAESQINTATPEGRARAAQLRSLYEGERAIYERDPTRTGNAMRLREGVGAAEFATRVATATGGNATAAANIFAGGGHGNAQALLSNMRSLMSVLGSERGQRVQEMMRGGGVDAAQIERHQTAVENDQLAQLTRAEEQGFNALTDNTSAIVNLSNQFATWSTANPMASSAMQSGGGLLGGAVGGALFPRIGNAIVNTGIGARLAGLAAGGGGILGSLGSVGAWLGTTLGAAGAGTVGAVAAGSAAAGGGIGTLINRGIYSDASASTAGGATTATAGGQAAYTNVFSSDFFRGFATSVSQAVRDGLSNATVNATVSPVDATHAAAQAPVAPR